MSFFFGFSRMCMRECVSAGTVSVCEHWGGVGWGGGAYTYNIVSEDFPWGFPYPLTPPEEERFTSLDLRVPAFPSVF